MAIKFNVTTPAYPESVFIAPTATVIGDVQLGEDVSIWYGACVRGDMATITIGRGSNVQENASIHVDPDVPVVIGADVTIGHNAVIHGCTIEDGALIGMGAIVLNGAVVGAGSLVGAGTLVREHMIIPPGGLVVGVPGKVLKQLSPEQQAHIAENSREYVACAQAHKAKG